MERRLGEGGGPPSRPGAAPREPRLTTREHLLWTLFTLEAHSPQSQLPTTKNPLLAPFRLQVVGVTGGQGCCAPIREQAEAFPSREWRAQGWLILKS